MAPALDPAHDDRVELKSRLFIQQKKRHCETWRFSCLERERILELAPPTLS